MHTIRAMAAKSIKLIAPSRFLPGDVLDRAAGLCRANGIEVGVSANCGLRHHQFAGTDEERADALVAEWNEGEADILWCARGGYGSGRLLALVRGRLEKRPKILIGYSDQTYLLAYFARNRLGMAVHGPMAIDVEYDKNGVLDGLFHAVKADDFSSSLRFSPAASRRVLREGRACGAVIVGNLSILTRLLGTPEEPDWTGAILIVEDVDEYAYAIDRMFLHLRDAGVLERIAGLGLGDFTEIKDNEISFGATVDDMALNYLGRRDIPVVAGLPVGHGRENSPVIFGGAGALLASREAITLTVGAP